ncbi:hypothetical protein AB4G91_12190 [Macrococcoides goetzii]|uniref:immunodominant staphylococcal antigen IsaB family protein n=1 Tax=Macrococcus sp. PK TaxID=2801919 RepID=UPI001F0E56BE|nr:hypothetical protein [Macrococcus sp. PK]MCH4985935.1 hypothetical protein [Macrococcus sp. PK]
MNKKLMKMALASTILLSAGVIQSNDGYAHMLKPYYQWKGYTGNSYTFLFDKNFKRALFNDNVTINGMKLSTNFNNDDISEGMNAFENLHNKQRYNKRFVIKKYDTIGYKSSKGKYFLIEFPVQKGKISIKQFSNHYGKYKIGTDVIKDSKGKIIERNVTYKVNNSILEATFDANNMLVNCYIYADTTMPF